MQRWQLTTGLAAGALLAAFIAPSVFRSGVMVPDPPAPPTPPTPSITLEPTAAPVTLGDGQAHDRGLSLTVALDQDAQLRSSGEERFVVLEVSADQLAGQTRQPVHLAVVMDTSGSMRGKDKITNARAAAIELAEMLGPEDTLSLVTFSDHAQTLIQRGSADEARRMRLLIEGIKPGGGTNLYDGMTTGQRLLQDTALAGVKRVVILSDGLANLGVQDPAELTRLAGSLVSEGVTVSGLGLGLDYDEDLLAAMSDAGGGGYHFISDATQLNGIFAGELTQMSALLARKVTVDVTLGEGVELLEVYGYDASTRLDGYQVFLGDLHGGATRKIVARVRVPDGQLGAQDVARASVAFTSAEDATPGLLTAHRALLVTDDLRAAEASVNAEAGAEAATAAAARLLEQSARAWAEGNTRATNDHLDEGATLLRSLSSRYNAPALDQMAQELESQKAEFSSASAGDEDGAYQLKKVKARARVYSR